MQMEFSSVPTDKSGTDNTFIGIFYNYVEFINNIQMLWFGNKQFLVKSSLYGQFNRRKGRWIGIYYYL